MPYSQNRFSRFAAILFATLLIAAASSARGDDGTESRPCSNEVLKGSYGFYRAGMTPNGPLAAIGTISFDGNGHSNVTQSISRGGEIDYDVTFQVST
jgi:hypothetical protein